MSALRVPLAFAPSTGVRVTRWRPDPQMAHLALTADRRRPLSAAELDRCLSDIERLGYRGVVTAALGPPDQRVFFDAGFEVVEQLHLLRHRFDPLPAYRSNATRRGRRRDHPAVLAVDAAAFLPFWQLDEATLNEALTATRASRLRVAEDSRGTIIGYAICGRSATRGYVQRLAVHPDHEGEGVGAALLIDGLHWLARWGARDALVNTQQGNERSLRLYLRTGFEPEPAGLAVLRCDFGGHLHPSDASARPHGRRALRSP
jgi:GNAT superfamily N-acetyltransferase